MQGKDTTLMYDIHRAVTKANRHEAVLDEAVTSRGYSRVLESYSNTSLRNVLEGHPVVWRQSSIMHM